jgi:hypothetical protein
MTKLGLYRHFKGGKYRVLFKAIDATNNAPDDRLMVIYISLANGLIFTRFEDEFNEWVPDEAEMLVPRFKYIGDEP